MQPDQQKLFRVDGDVLAVTYHYDEETALYFGRFPAFEEEPRYTPHGRPWKNAVSTGCPYAAGEYDDCGSCPHLIRAEARDIIGVCFHEKLHSRASPGTILSAGEIMQPSGC